MVRHSRWGGWRISGCRAPARVRLGLRTLSGRIPLASRLGPNYFRTRGMDSECGIHRRKLSRYLAVAAVLDIALGKIGGLKNS